MAVLTDAERSAYFDRKKKEVIERLLGPGMPYPIPDPVTVRYTIDPKAGSWYDSPRVFKRMEIDLKCAEYLRWFNEQMRLTHGHIVTIVENVSNPEVPPPVK